MKEEILSIASDLREGFISTDEAKAQLLCLSSVVTQNELPEGRLLCLSSVATQSELLEGWVDLEDVLLENCLFLFFFILILVCFFPTLPSSS